jgi:hypothetical protein
VGLRLRYGEQRGHHRAESFRQEPQLRSWAPDLVEVKVRRRQGLENSEPDADRDHERAADELGSADALGQDRSARERAVREQRNPEGEADNRGEHVGVREEREQEHHEGEAEGSGAESGTGREQEQHPEAVVPAHDRVFVEGKVAEGEQHALERRERRIAGKDPYGGRTDREVQQLHRDRRISHPAQQEKAGVPEAGVALVLDVAEQLRE